MTKLLILLYLAPGGVELPRIGCWNEPASGEARVLFGIRGNLLVRTAGDEGCPNTASFGDRDEHGVRTLHISDKWRLAEAPEGERYLLYGAGERYELPR